jgi:nucleoside-diphosphate-sugar epimerase
MGNLKTLSNASRSVSVLGANGFIGSTIVSNLVKNHWKIEHNAPFKIDNLSDLVGSGSLINCIGTFSSDDNLAYRVNSKFPEELAKWAAKVDTPLIHFGSSAEYEPSTNLISETGFTKKSNLYSRSKLYGTKAVIEFGPEGKSLVLRPFGVIQEPLEPRPMHPSKLSHIISEARTKNRVQIKNPKAVRDLIGVNQLAEATVRILTTPYPWPTILNICSGVGYPLEDVVRFINPNIEILGQKTDSSDAYVGDADLLNKFLAFNFEKKLTNIFSYLTADNAKYEN